MTDARRSRRALLVAGAVFAVAAAWTASHAVPLFTSLGADARTLRQDLAAARGQTQAPFVQRVDRARDAVAEAGWGFAPSAPLPSFDCWQEGDTTACDLFAHADAQVAVPADVARQAVELERLGSVTDAALAADGWRCSAPVRVRPAAGTVVDCSSGTAELRVSVRTASGAGSALTTQAATSRAELRLDLSALAYRSGTTVTCCGGGTT